MPAPENTFKKAIAAGKPQTGLWLALASPYSAELIGGAGFDWLLIDGEHAPNDIPTIMAQLQALQASASHAIVRPPVGESWMLKQLLDIGAQTVLVPMVESAEEAKALAAAVRYPPIGKRGIGASLGRASAFNRHTDYLATADDEICLLVQVESRAGLGALDAIVATPGIDGVFIGPADLAADMGHIGLPGHPDVVEAVENAIRRIVTLGKPAGVLTADEQLAARYRDAGATFVAIGSDVGLLSAGSSRLLSSYKAGKA